MANVEGNFTALRRFYEMVTGSLGIEFDLPSGREPILPFERVWLPPTPSVGVTTPTSVNCYQQLPRVPNNAVRVECGRAFTLTLDREWTTPQAIIGVKFTAPPTSRTDCVILVPGDTVNVPSGFNHFWVYAADNADLWGGVPAPLVGYVSFLVGRSFGCGLPKQSTAHPQARLMSLARSTAPDFGVATFLANGLVKKVRIILAPTGAAGAAFAAGQFYSSIIEMQPRIRVEQSDANVPIQLLETPDQGLNVGAGLGVGWAGNAAGQRMKVVSSASHLQNGVNVNSQSEAIFDLESSGLFYTANANPAATNTLTFSGSTAPTGFQLMVEAVEDNAVEEPTVILADMLSGANTALAIQNIPTIDLEHVGIIIEASGAIVGTPAVTLRAWDQVTFSYHIALIYNLTAGVTAAATGWGPGVVFAAPNQGIPLPLPFRIEVDVPALGAGVTARVFVWGSRKRKNN